MSSPMWRKPSRSDTQGNNCVELAAFPNAVGIRDSKRPAGGVLTLECDRFAALLDRIKQNRLDR